MDCIAKQQLLSELSLKLHVLSVRLFSGNILLNNVCNFEYLFIPGKNNLPRIKVRNVNNPLIENQLLVYQEILRESRYVIGKSVYASKGNSKPS